MNTTIIVAHSPVRTWGTIYEKLTFTNVFMKAEEIQCSKAKRYIRDHGLVKVYESNFGQVWDVPDAKERVRRTKKLAVAEVNPDETRGGLIMEEYKQAIRDNAEYFDMRVIKSKREALIKKLNSLDYGEAIYINADHCGLSTARGAACKCRTEKVSIRTFAEGSICYMIKEHGRKKYENG